VVEMMIVGTSFRGYVIMIFVVLIDSVFGLFF
jgi:hypothetical protein